MNESNSKKSNTSDQMSSVNTTEEHSFILQQRSNSDRQKDKYSYKLKAPLCISQTYKEDFFDCVNLIGFNYILILSFMNLFLVSYELLW